MSRQPSLQDEGSNPGENAEGATLAQLIGRADLWFRKKLLAALESGDHKGIGSSDILMLANLNCGRTYPSEVARRIGISRQAVYKLLRNLEQQEIVSLEQDSERRNSKVIVITSKGEAMIRDAVILLQGIEEELRDKIGAESVDQLRAALELDWADS
ncbi:MAG: MarR family winged helix-turn-helix transcriptional regulator [Verrucomicrobiales bacterium]